MTSGLHLGRRRGAALGDAGVGRRHFGLAVLVHLLAGHLHDAGRLGIDLGQCRLEAGHVVGGLGPEPLGGLRVDLSRREVTVDGKSVHLTPNEFRLMSVLIKNAGKVLTHRHLLREVWGPDSNEETHYLRVYMNQLRQKLETDSARPQYILTESGVGYRLISEI